MPVYILHGFRWPRGDQSLTCIRVHIILQNLDDAAAEYIQAPRSQASILQSLRQAFPEIMANLHTLQFVEQYDPDDTSSLNAVSQPWAFVADKVVTMAGGGVSVPAGTAHGDVGGRKRDTKGSGMDIAGGGGALSVNLEDVTSEGPGLTARGWEALADLRDKIAPGERIGWWVVYNGDPERRYPGMEDEDIMEEGDEGSETAREQGPPVGVLSFLLEERTVFFP